MQAPLCSVVVVSYNSGPMLAECARAVFASSVPVQLLLSDNASTDGSLEAVRSEWSDDPRLVARENPSNLGFARACNRVLPDAAGDWVLFLNPDCVLEPDTLERMFAVLREWPDAGMAGCLLRNPDGSEQAGCRRREPTPWRSLARVMHLQWLRPDDPRLADFNMAREPLPGEPVPVDAISGAFMLVRREALDRVGPLDEGYFLHCEDLDWCRRFRDQGYQVLFVPGVEVLHAKGGSSRSRPVRVEWHKHRGMLRYYRKFYRDAYPRPLLWLVHAAVWSRFALVAPLVTWRRLRS
jgi:GT2 family glycosyltransferase